eukprot:NODE_2324_length_955_cov_323.538889.p2 GENE.NODE_2324_length_955_cov_323.538889~~NODE_2324_length_955_cov_323.538889.p2  ORF type:complete len:164 (+),score=31.66 NODE_2324_length_955_cov_323.538889:3-494(+)
MGGTYLLTASETTAAVTEALRAGYRHVDAAEGYATEAEVAEGLRQSGVPRGDVFITSKVYPTDSNMLVKDCDAVIASCEGSLAKMQMDSFDLYLIHTARAGEKRVEQWKGLVELQKRGKCKSIGVSNYAIDHLEEIRQAGLPMPAANQLECTRSASGRRCCVT